MVSINFTELASNIETVAEATEIKIDDEARKRLLQACDKLRTSLESPFEFTLRVIFAGHQAMALRLGIDMKLFDAVAQHTKSGPVTVTQLADASQADPLLVSRIMRFLAAMGIFDEVNPDVYVSTQLAAAYVSGSPLSAAVIHVTHFLMILSQLPAYFKNNGWKNPNDVYDGPFQYAMGTTSHYFDFLASEPYYQQAFNTVMTISHRRQGQNWFNFFPVEEKMGDAKDSDVLLVDVGGSQGGDITAFQQTFPHLQGRLVLQDLPIVINAMTEFPTGIECQGHDFFDEQPVKGAKAYYLRTVLHDWPDKQARQILAKIREAMAPDSLLLINETLIPESNVALSSAQADLTMMVSFASLERTKAQFENLLNESGFELVKVWMPEGLTASSAELSKQATLLEARPRPI
ncbi:S-adenosyl-L-methionine-dependent methyltransferase [Aspergillus sclerotiicarbonarius CBS 121057]|uniref:S-adenosyl-L-methionine-dependent methyltransferase n=1 Tax=Aspergillus sclerotiicarbonarius (strain CBS 121057 / IBT 28362) TaxID=1448318 RepID=A0A319EQM9_ASPSB|nr:S-adenosyl-L-methionine-dependent methyltransferase [Aspergillus sclerotiicarbonarius CBS 121057]